MHDKPLLACAAMKVALDVIHMHDPASYEVLLYAFVL
jgi:hypothetical protein